MLKRLIDQMHWANAATLEWLKEEHKDKEAYLRLASHILNAEAIWVRRVKAEPHEKDTFKVHDPATLAAMNDANHWDWLAQLEGDPGRVIDYRMLDGTAVSSRF